MTGRDELLREMTRIGATGAARALSAMFGEPVSVQPERCRWLRLDEIAGALFDPEERIAGVFGDLTGAVRGEAGVLMARHVVDRVLGLLIGAKPGAELDARAQSALGEVGNIVLSAAAGAFGDYAGGIVLPSTPRLAFDMAGAILVEAVHPYMDRLPARLVETGISDPEGSLRMRFVWIPEDDS